MATTTRTRSTGTAKRTPRIRAKAPAASAPTIGASARNRVNAVSKDAKATVRSLRTQTRQAIGSVPVNRTTISIAIGALAAAALAGIGALLGRERLMQAATTSRDKLRQTADDLSTVAHEKIDQARDNITKLRTRTATPAQTPEQDLPIAM